MAGLSVLLQCPIEFQVAEDPFILEIIHVNYHLVHCYFLTSSENSTTVLKKKIKINSYALINNR